jgi:hypothetical protein
MCILSQLQSLKPGLLHTTVVLSENFISYNSSTLGPRRDPFPFSQPLFKPST